MRVIAGKVKGARLKAPGSARPVTNLVRGAVFSILAGLVSEETLVLDLFAGSGALGIEALSRGAGGVDFVEQNPRSCAIIKENLQGAGLATSGRVYCSPVSKALRHLPGEYDLVLMDPPYALPGLSELVAEVALSGKVKPGGLLVMCHSPRHPLLPSYQGLTLIKQRRHGDTCISLFARGGAL